MTPLDLSLCMIVKDEAAHLERCLSSVQGIVSEIIIADTGSQDGSIRIAERFGARVLRLPWDNDFSQARNKTLEEAGCAWILVLDADEEADAWPREELSLLLQNEDALGYYLPFINYLGEAAGPNDRDYVTDSVCRLFRNDARIRFRGRIHEEVVQSIMELPGAQIPFSTLRIRHYGYTQTEIRRKNKNQRNLGLIEIALTEQPERLTLHYALGTEYFQEKRYDKAAQIFIPLLQKVAPQDGYLSDLYLKTAYALTKSGYSEQAEQTMTEGLSLFPDFTDLIEAKACLFMEQRKYQEAYLLVRQALQIGDVSAKYTSSSGSGTYRSHWLAGHACDHMLQFREAAEHYFQAIALQADYYAAWREYIPLSLLLGDTARMASFLASHQESITEKHLGIILPAALSSGTCEWLEPALWTRKLEFPYSSIAFALYALLGGERKQAVQLLRKLHAKAPEHPDILAYLWAMAWSDGHRAPEPGYWHRLLSKHEHRLVGIQLRLGGDAVAPLREADLVYGMQLLVQTGAWEAVVALYRKADPRFPWAAMPLPLLLGLAKAPDAVKKRLCRLFEQKLTQAEDGAALDCTEFVLFSFLAQSCGEALPVQTLKRASRLLAAHPAAMAAAAHQWLAHAGRAYDGLAAKPMDASLLLRFSRLQSTNIIG